MLRESPLLVFSGRANPALTDVRRAISDELAALDVADHLVVLADGAPGDGGPVAADALDQPVGLLLLAVQAAADHPERHGLVALDEQVEQVLEHLLVAGGGAFDDACEDNRKEYSSNTDQRTHERYVVHCNFHSFLHSVVSVKSWFPVKPIHGFLCTFAKDHFDGRDGL